MSIKNRRGLPLIFGGLLLIVAALSLVGYNLYTSWRGQQAAETALEQLLPEIPQPLEEDQVAAEPEYPDYVLNPEMDMPLRKVDDLDYVATLTIPGLELELPIIDQWSYHNLRFAPCRYSGSAYLDNMVICAHNFSKHFGHLLELSSGDPLSLMDMDGNIFNYQVVELEILQPTDIELMTSGDWDLTLFTCTVGGRTRIALRCERIND